MIRRGWVVTSLAWAALLALHAIASHEDGRLWGLMTELRFNGAWWAFARSVIWTATLAVLPSIVLGALCRLAVAVRPGAVAALVALACSWVLAALVDGFEPSAEWRAPAAVELLAPAVGCLIGVILSGAFVGRTTGAFASLLWRIGLLGGAAGLGSFVLATMVLSEAAPDAPQAKITSDQKRALVGELRSRNPLKLAADASGSLELEPAELESLLAWGALLVDDEARVAARGRSGAMGWLASVRLPAAPGSYGQLTLAGELAIAAGPDELQIDRCRLAAGRLALASWFCESMLKSLYRSIGSSLEFGPFVAAVQSLRVDDAGLAARFVRPHLDEAARHRLQLALGPGREVRAAIRAQVNLLRANGAELARSDDRFAAIMRAAFKLAERRSATGAPVAENQGAILALATILGHEDVAILAGIDRPDDLLAIREVLWPVLLRGRADWSRHFLVSAGLTQISTAVMSDAAGLLKEELDMASPSGFSFADLLADRAGTRFGELAVRDPVTARALQAALAHDPRATALLMPPAADLPEGLITDELNSRYGGVGGAQYHEVIAEIEGRVDRLPVF